MYQALTYQQHRAASESFLEMMQDSTFSTSPNGSFIHGLYHHSSEFLSAAATTQDQLLGRSYLKHQATTRTAQRDGSGEWPIMLMMELGHLFEPLLWNFWQSILKLRFLFYLVWPTETMFSSLKEVPRYVTEMFPVFFFVAFVENTMRLLQGKAPIRVNETIGSLSQGIFQECLRIKVRSIEVLMYCLVWEHFRLMELPWQSLWTWWLCYLAVDLGFYWAHRLAHEVNFIWAIHQAHHSSEEFSVVSALRQAVLQPFTAWFTYVPLALFIPPQIFLAHLQLSELYMAWIHTEVVDSIGPLEWILNTPSHHRVHHSRNPEYIDKNYGGMLIIWDRLFGTFKDEDRETNPPVYGLVHPIRSFNPMEVQFHPWPIIWRRITRAKSLGDKLRVVFCGPGWRPGLTSRLGNPDELPRIVRPVQSYDPRISWWKNAYIIVHFGIILMFYHELTLFQHQFSSSILNVALISLVASITSLGLILDNKRHYRNVLELTRCLLFFQVRKSILLIIDAGLERSGVSLQLRALIASLLVLIFAVSVAIIGLDLLISYSHLFVGQVRWREIDASKEMLVESGRNSVRRKSEKIRVM